jgi:predicted metal-dependent phosphotriesterase family hydrolase
VTTNVVTVLGPVNAAELGITMCHEHLFIDLWTEFQRDGVLNDPEVAAQELTKYATLGGRTIVDVTSRDIGRNPAGLASLARLTGVNVIMGTGHYRHPYLDEPWFDRHDATQIAEQLAREAEDGVDDTGIRPGIIGEIGCERGWIGAAEERSFRAAARAQRLTGLTVTTHAAGWPVGNLQLDILESEGCNPNRVIVGHCDTVPDTNYHHSLAARGAFVEFDTVRENNEHELAQRVHYVTTLASRGHLDKILLSQDICLRQHLESRGGGGYSFILSRFLPRLRSAGMTEAEVDQILVANPRRALTGAL